MKSQIITIRVDYGSDAQYEAFKDTMSVVLLAIKYNLEASNKKNKISYEIEDAETAKK